MVHEPSAERNGNRELLELQEAERIWAMPTQQNESRLWQKGESGGEGESKSEKVEGDPDTLTLQRAAASSCVGRAHRVAHRPHVRALPRGA